MHLNELKALHVSEVLKQAEALEIENTGRMRKQELMFAIIKKRAKAGEQVNADGVLEVLPDGFGFLRNMDTSFTASTDDIYISPSQIRRFNLHTGDMIEGEVRTPKDGERYFALNKLDKVNGDLPESNKQALTNALRELESDGLLVRSVVRQKPLHVEYMLTDQARTIIGLLRAMEP